MSQRQVHGIEIAEPLGWQMTDDRMHVLVAFKDTQGQEIALAVSPDNLWKVLMSFVDATAAFPVPKGTGLKNVKTLDTNWYEVGRNVDTGQIILSLFRENGAVLSFRMDLTMALRLGETLSTLGGAAGASAPPPGTPKN